MNPRIIAAIAALEADFDNYWISPDLKAHIQALIEIAREQAVSLDHAKTVVDDINLR